MSSILLDASSLPKQPVGAGLYIINLVRGLFHSNSNFQFTVLSHKADFQLFSLEENYKKYFLFQRDLGRSARIISEQMLYPSIIKNRKFDLFHGLHYSFPITKLCPTIVTIHDLSYFIHPERHIWIKRFYFRSFIMFACRKADRILSVSSNTREDLINIAKCEPKKITVTNLGVENRFFEEQRFEKGIEVSKKYNLPENFLLFIGLIEPRKNVPLLIKAFLKLVDQQKITGDLVIAGRWGWESKHLLDEIHQHPHGSKIHFIGYVEDVDKPALYRLAKIFVYPSAYEGFGLPVLEAMASGAPVITTNVSSMPEIIKDCGILIEPNNQLSLEKAIMELDNNSSARELLSKKAKIRAQEFSWQNTVNQTLFAYEKVLRDQGKS